MAENDRKNDNPHRKTEKDKNDNPYRRKPKTKTEVALYGEEVKNNKK